MNTNSEKLLLKEEALQVVGCAIDVLNTLGHGLVEKPYENALVRRVFTAEDSFSTATLVRRALQRPQDWPFCS
jgi:hypothetical protein